MKRKLFGTVRVFIGVWLLSWVWIDISKKSPMAINVGVSILFLVAALAYSYFMFIPLFEYDENEIFLRYPFGVGGKRYQWFEVKEIYSMEFPFSTKLVFDNNWSVRLMASNTRNYFEVLKEIIELVKEKNRNVEIDDTTLKLLNKHPKYYI